MAVIVSLNSKSDRYQRTRPAAPGGRTTAKIILLPCVRREAIPERAGEGGVVMKRQACSSRAVRRRSIIVAERAAPGGRPPDASVPGEGDGDQPSRLAAG